MWNVLMGSQSAGDNPLPWFGPLCVCVWYTIKSRLFSYKRCCIELSIPWSLQVPLCGLFSVLEHVVTLFAIRTQFALHINPWKLLPLLGFFSSSSCFFTQISLPFSPSPDCRGRFRDDPKRGGGWGHPFAAGRIQIPNGDVQRERTEQQQQQ